MRFWWLTDRVSQNMFDVSWAPGPTNLADYFSKHHPAKHVRNLRPVYTSQKDSPRSLQGCVKLLALAVSPYTNPVRRTDSKPNPVPLNPVTLKPVTLKPVLANPVQLIPLAERSTDSRRRVTTNRNKLKLSNNKIQSRDPGPPSKMISRMRIISRMLNTRLSSLIF